MSHAKPFAMLLRTGIAYLKIVVRRKNTKIPAGVPATEVIAMRPWGAVCIAIVNSAAIASTVQPLVLELRVRSDTSMRILDSWEHPEADLSHGAAVEATIVQGEPLFFSLKLLNAGSETVRTARPSASDGFLVEVVTPGGTTIDAVGARRRLDCWGPVDVTLEPREEILINSFVYEYRAEQPRYDDEMSYCFSLPGTYTIMAMYRPAKSSVYNQYNPDLSAYPYVESNTIRVLVTEPRQADRPGPSFEEVCRAIQDPAGEVSEAVLAEPTPGSALADREAVEPWLASLREHVLQAKRDLQDYMLRQRRDLEQSEIGHGLAVREICFLVYGHVYRMPYLGLQMITDRNRED